jgi:hypothetical protein
VTYVTGLSDKTAPFRSSPFDAPPLLPVAKLLLFWRAVLSAEKASTFRWTAPKPCL